MYLKPRTKLRLHFNHNLADFDGDVYFPNEGHQIKRSPMRRRYNKEGQNPWTEWYSDLGHGCEDWHTADTMIEGFIHKNIGNKFDDVFHEFMGKVRVRRELHCYGYHTPKSMFLSYFEKEKRWRKREGTYYVNDDGIICQTPWKPRRPKDIVIYKTPAWNNQYIYTLKEDALLSISVPFITLFGKYLYDEVHAKKVFDEYELDKLHHRMNKICSDKMLDEVFNVVKRYREYKPYYYRCRYVRWIDFLFTSKYNNIERVIRYGTKEYFRYMKEKKRSKALAIKEKKHPNRSHFDATLKTKKLAHNEERRTEDFRQRLKNIFEGEM